MIMIVFHHIVSSNYLLTTDFSLSQIRYNIIVTWGKIWVNLFIFISWFYLINDKQIFNIKKFIKLLFETFFYSIIIYFLFLLLWKANYYDIRTYIFPLTNKVWRFITVYIVLYLLHPIINRAIITLDKQTFKTILIILILWRIIIPTFSPTDWLDFSNELLRFITAYMIWGYIRLHTTLNHDNTKKHLTQWISFFIITFLINILISTIEAKSPINLPNRIHNIISVRTPYSLTILPSSIYLFTGFIQLKLKYNKYINIIASTTFWIYLIHEHPLIKNILRHRRINLRDYENLIIIIFYSVLIVIIIFISCAIIDLIRQYTIEKPFLILINKYIENIEKYAKKIISSVKIF